jgi:hypothetical protein
VKLWSIRPVEISPTIGNQKNDRVQPRLLDEFAGCGKCSAKAIVLLRRLAVEQRRVGDSLPKLSDTVPRLSEIGLTSDIL